MDLKIEGARDLKKIKSVSLPIDFVKQGTYKARFSNGRESSESKIRVQ